MALLQMFKTDKDGAAEFRIQRRLRLQHARWLLRQPTKDQFWFRFCRKSQRVVRQSCLRIEKLIGGAGEWLAKFPLARAIGIGLLWLAIVSLFLGAVGLVLGLIAIASELLLAEPSRYQFKAGDAELVALTRLVVLGTFSIAWLLCMIPGTNRQSALLGPQQNPRRLHLFCKPRVRCNAIEAKSLFWILIALFVFAVSGTCNALRATEHPIAGAVCAVIVILSTFFLIYRMGLRLMQYRAPVLLRHSAFEYGACLFGFMALASLIAVMTPSITHASRHLSLLGPLGFLLGEVHGVSQGSASSAIVLSATCLVFVALGWWVARDIDTFAARRRLVESRRLLMTSAAIAQSQDEPSKCSVESLVLRDLSETVIGRRNRSWRFWLAPIWLRKRIVWFALATGCLVFFDTVIFCILSVVSGFDAAPVFGQAGLREQAALQTTSGRQIVLLSLVPIALVLGGSEVIALLDRTQLQQHSFQSRPISTWRLLVEVHRDGVTRLPVQLLLALPFAVVPMMGSVSFVDLAKLLTLSMAVLLIMRTLMATLSVYLSIKSIANMWVSEALKCIIYVASVVTLVSMLVHPIVLVDSMVNYQGAQVVMALLNVAALSLFGTVAALRAQYAKGAKP